MGQSTAACRYIALWREDRIAQLPLSWHFPEWESLAVLNRIPGCDQLSAWLRPVEAVNRLRMLTLLNMVSIAAERNCIVRSSISKPTRFNTQRTLLFYVVPDDALLLSAPVPVFFSIALVVGFLAYRQCDAGFYQVAFPVQLGAYAGLSLLRGGREYFR